MNDNDDTRTLPAPDATAAEARPSERLRIPFAVLNVAWAVTGQTPDELLRSLDALVELAPGVLVEPSQLQWHPLLNRFVYRSPDGGLADLERIGIALRRGVSDGSHLYPADGHHLTENDPTLWHRVSDTHDICDPVPYSRWQRFDPILGAMLYVYEMIDRSTVPHTSSCRWVARGLNGEYQLVDMRNGMEASFGSCDDAMETADAAVLGERLGHCWVPSSMRVLKLISREPTP